MQQLAQLKRSYMLNPVTHAIREAVGAATPDY
jgi:hypothetical protein